MTNLIKSSITYNSKSINYIIDVKSKSLELDKSTITESVNIEKICKLIISALPKKIRRQFKLDYCLIF